MTPKKSWLKNLMQMSDQQDDKTVASLQRFPPLADLSENEIRALAQKCYIRHFSADEEIYAEKSPPAAVYFIIYGSIGLFIKRRNTMTDRVQAIKAGNFFGETSLVHEAPRKQSARALEKTLVIALFKSDFQDLEQSHPRLALHLLKLITTKISKELHIFQTEFHELSQKLARDQLLD